MYDRRGELGQRVSAALRELGYFRVRSSDPSPEEEEEEEEE